MHRSLVEGVDVPADVPAGMCVPSMTAVSTDNEVSRLGPLGPEVVEIARRVRDTNVGLTEAAHRPGMEG